MDSVFHFKSLVKLFLLLTLVIDGIGDNRLESKGEGSLLVPLQEDLQIRDHISGKWRTTNYKNRGVGRKIGKV